TGSGHGEYVSARRQVHLVAGRVVRLRLLIPVIRDRGFGWSEDQLDDRVAGYRRQHHVGARNLHGLSRPEGALEPLRRELVASKFDRVVARRDRVVSKVAVPADGADAFLVDQYFRA